MNQLRQNILANFLGRGWSATMSLIFVPVYIRYMGMEAYGLVGVFVSLQALVSIFDFGMGSAFNREMARFSGSGGESRTTRDLARTLETVYWIIGTVIGCVVVALSGLIARNWVKAEQLDPTTIRRAVALMGAVFVLQWPTALYAGGLRGLQRQVRLNVITAATGTVRGIGAIVILGSVSASIEAFFLWQLAVSILQTLATGIGLWSCMPRGAQRPAIRFGLLRTVRSYATSITVLSVVILLLGQSDKVILSKCLSLAAFGCYNLAATVAASLALPMTPISEALFPRMSQLAAQSKNAELGRLFHRGAQIASVALCPLAGMFLFFSREILVLWTGDAALAARVYLLLSLLSFGVVLHYGVMGVLDVLQMSYGWLRPTLIGRSLALVLLGPLMVWMTLRYGAVGAAISWLIIYTAYFLIVPHLVFRRLLVAEMSRWYWNDFGMPLVIAVAFAGAARVLVAIPAGKLALAAYLVVLLGVTMLAVALSMTYVRGILGGAANRVIRRPALS
jgi:O-antigen/teichoic acid export membrane protein